MKRSWITNHANFANQNTFLFVRFVKISDPKTFPAKLLFGNELPSKTCTKNKQLMDSSTDARRFLHTEATSAASGNIRESLQIFHNHFVRGRQRNSENFQDKRHGFGTESALESSLLMSSLFQIKPCKRGVGPRPDRLFSSGH